MKKFKGSAAAPNPDPRSFKIIRTEELGNFTLVELQYIGCTNYEGRKIMLLAGIGSIGLLALDYIDPHFGEEGSQPFQLLARFVPTNCGWVLGQTLMKRLALAQ